MEDSLSFKNYISSESFSRLYEALDEKSASESRKVLNRYREADHLSLEDIACLLSKGAREELEEMAHAAQRKSLQHFGRAVVLYTPLYLSNYCINRCLYCNYGVDHDIKRRRLNPSEIQREADAVRKTGLRHVLLLTGESEKHFSIQEIISSVKITKQFFDAVSLESYALSIEEYSALENFGLVGVTLYQETYDLERYQFLHASGPKSDYSWRLDAPVRVGLSGIRQMNLGVLLGLADWRKDVLSLIAHGRFLQKNFPEMEISFSLPRMIAFEGADFESLGIKPVSDQEFVQALCVIRLAMPHCSINLSTRESALMRRHLLPIGINKMSAGVSTEVGGHSLTDSGEGQFKISDDSSVDAVRRMIIEAGYQPVLRDWIQF